MIKQIIKGFILMVSEVIYLTLLPVDNPLCYLYLGNLFIFFIMTLEIMGKETP